jgi:hypothetical protein
VSATTEALWLRALGALSARGLLPANKSRLTSRELGTEVARRGDDRLARLVDGWYYPASYGGVRGVLSDEDATRLVAELEENITPVEFVPREMLRPGVENRPSRREPGCELCGFPVSLR